MPYAAQIRFHGVGEGLKTKLFDSEKEADDYVIKRYPSHDTRILQLKKGEAWPEKW